MARASPEQRFPDDQVLGAELISYGEVVDWFPSRVSPTPRPDDLVWLINLGTSSGELMAQGTRVMVDFYTGEVLQVEDWIS